MGVNKVVYGTTTIIDISDSTVAENNLLEGCKAYGANGDVVEGKIPIYDGTRIEMFKDHGNADTDTHFGFVGNGGYHCLLEDYIDAKVPKTEFGDANASHVLEGKTFTSESGTKINGGIPRYDPAKMYGTGEVIQTQEQGVVLIEGTIDRPCYVDGSVYLEVNDQEFGDASTTDVLEGKTFTSQYGYKVTGNIPTKTSSNLVASGAKVIVPKGYYSSQAEKSVATTTQATPSISVSNTGLITASATQTAGYVSDGTRSATHQLTTKSSSDLTANGATVTVPAGYYASDATTSVTTVDRATPTLKCEKELNGNRLIFTASATQGTGYVEGGTSTTEKKYVSISANGAEVTVTDGEHEIGHTVATADRAPTTATTTANQSAGTLTVTASNNQLKGYSPGGNQTASKVITLTASGATVTATDNSSTPVKVSKSVATGSAATPATTITANPTLATTPTGTRGYLMSVSKTQSVTPSVTAGYVSSGTAGTITVSGSAYVPESLTGSAASSTTATAARTIGYGQQAIIGAGYYPSDRIIRNSVSAGSATTPATTITKNPTISVSSAGVITASVSGTQNVTPTVSAGYVSSGTAGTITVSGSATQQLSTQAAATITPGTSNKTAVASGKYTTGAVTVKGDANLVAGNIKQGTSIFGVVGTYEGSGGFAINLPTCTVTVVDNDYAGGIVVTTLTNEGGKLIWKNTTVPTGGRATITYAWRTPIFMTSTFSWFDAYDGDNDYMSNCPYKYDSTTRLYAIYPQVDSGTSHTIECYL